MNKWQAPDVGSRRGRVLLWCLLWLLAAAALGPAVGHLFGHIPYRIDIDIYQMGGRAWLDGRPLYRGDVLFPTPIGLNLPFTYPPLAAVAFCPFAWLGMPAASVAITLMTLVLLIVSTMIVLTRLDVWTTSTLAARAGLVAPVVVGRGHRGPGSALAGAHQFELRLRPDQRRADDPGDRRLLPAPHAMAPRAAAGLGDSAEAHSGGVPALLPAPSRQPRGVDLVSVFRGRNAARFRAGVERLVGVLDSYGAPHRPDRHRGVEHRPEHRGCPRPARPW